jgi:hypothetical protein
MTYTAIYLEDDAGQYELLAVASDLLLEREGYAPAWLDLSTSLADGDLWAVRLVTGDSLEDFPQILGE